METSPSRRILNFEGRLEKKNPKWTIYVSGRFELLHNLFITIIAKMALSTNNNLQQGSSTLISNNTSESTPIKKKIKITH